MDREYAETRLTTSEHQVYQLLVGSPLPMDALAQLIGISPRTMRVHTTRIYRKCKVKSRQELTVFNLGKQRDASVSMFGDVLNFHRKFVLPTVKHPTENLSPELRKFRINFMLEELVEYCEAVGVNLHIDTDAAAIPQVDVFYDPESALDALIDLVYVALGTAAMHKFPFDEGWRRVHRANMKKIRAKSAVQSKRGTSYDVIKPPGWEPPKLSDLVER